MPTTPNPVCRSLGTKFAPSVALTPDPAIAVRLGIGGVNVLPNCIVVEGLSRFYSVSKLVLKPIDVVGDKIDMKNAKMMGAYINSEREAVVESDDPHALVAVLFDELLKSMHIFFQNLDKKQANLESRSKHLSRSLSLIYALQKSLDFEKGGDLIATSRSSAFSVFEESIILSREYS